MIMKQAFLIVAHKNFDQLVKLVEYIADEEHHVYLHIDKKSENLFHQLRDYFKTYESHNMFIIYKYFKITNFIW